MINDDDDDDDDDGDDGTYTVFPRSKVKKKKNCKMHS